MAVHEPPFALYLAGDAYSTAKKIMGRQAAGQSFVASMARIWPDAELCTVGTDRYAAAAMLEQLRAQDFRGRLTWEGLPRLNLLGRKGTLYYPAPPSKELAALRNASCPSRFSMMGVTHTLSSRAALEQISDLVLPPFKPWDALICTSQVARTLVMDMHERTRAYWRETTGASQFNNPQLPVIPLGVDTARLAASPDRRNAIRQQLGLADDAVVLLFAGRLAFHAKGNPAALYQALQDVAGIAPLVCIEAGIHPNEPVRQAYIDAQTKLAPSVQFIHIEGRQSEVYQDVWQAADIFVSLSDNIQETFGLTPVEAMAAGLPVVVSDWNGYKDTVRHGIDGYRVPTILPPGGTGDDFARRHLIGSLNYDYYIGNVSLSTVVDPAALRAALDALISSPERRRQMGQAAAEQARNRYDWSETLSAYCDLSSELAEIRASAAAESGRQRPWDDDPFRLFAHFSTGILSGDVRIRARPDAAQRLDLLLTLNVAAFGFDTGFCAITTLRDLLELMRKEMSASEVLGWGGRPVSAANVRALMWLWKFDIVEVRMRT